ncbi:MAG: carbohydrate porin [Deltaproteobacteria bacterium]|nr:carbohydrate porin [Deltaproteobacteria bacterium]
MKRLFFAIAFCLFVFLSQAAAAEEKAEPKKAAYGSELEELKQRIEDLEKRVKSTEVVDELGHKFHPIHSIYGLKIGGGLTVTAQGVLHDKSNNQRGAGAISADIALESPVGKDGRAVAILDFQRGPGLQNLPSFFTSPNGNTSGANADIESFNNDQIHVTQFYYEHNMTSDLTATIGQLDITGYFDSNEFANNERTQFLANLFVNNPAIEFGGSADFYSPGIRLTYGPVEAMDITVGAFEGNGDYVDMFNKLFLMAEMNFKLKPLGNDGNYRVYYWDRQGRDSLTNTANPDDANLLKAENKGAGLSMDQVIADGVGIWLRAGFQRKKVAQFDRFIGGGLNIGGDIFGRANDAIGIGYGIAMMGKDYKDYKKSALSGFKAGTEHYMELYYNIAIADAAQNTGFHISPDIQYVINPGGDTNATKVFIYGIRLQTFF